MGWVARDVACRLQSQFGRYDALEWRRFLADQRMRYRFVELRYATLALVSGNTVYIQRGLPDIVEALVVWHECGHWAMHEGGADFWLDRPQGYITVSKMERQAWEWALAFPDWSGRDE